MRKRYGGALCNWMRRESRQLQLKISVRKDSGSIGAQESVMKKEYVLPLNLCHNGSFKRVQVERKMNNDSGISRTIFNQQSE